MPHAAHTTQASRHDLGSQPSMFTAPASSSASATGATGPGSPNPRFPEGDRPACPGGAGRPPSWTTTPLTKTARWRRQAGASASALARPLHADLRLDQSGRNAGSVRTDAKQLQRGVRGRRRATVRHPNNRATMDPKPFKWTSRPTASSPPFNANCLRRRCRRNFRATRPGRLNPRGVRNQKPVCAVLKGGRLRRPTFSCGRRFPELYRMQRTATYAFPGAPAARRRRRISAAPGSRHPYVAPTDVIPA